MSGERRTSLSLQGVDMLNVRMAVSMTLLDLEGSSRLDNAILA